MSDGPVNPGHQMNWLSNKTFDVLMIVIAFVFIATAVVCDYDPATEWENLEE